MADDIDPTPNPDNRTDRGADGPAGSDLEPEDSAVEEAGVHVARLLAELADDPDAPPTTVSSLSVIAAARAAARAEGPESAASTEIAVRAKGEVASSASAPPEPAASVGELHVRAAQAEAEQRRRGRRRTGLIALVAAASLAGIAAIAIPLSISGSSSTDTSANAAREATAATAGTAAAAAQSAEALAAQPEGGSAADQADSAAGAAGAAPNTGGESTGVDAGRPPPGPDAITESVPAQGDIASDTAPAAEAVPTCWPALPEAASNALINAVPAGAFGAPTQLNAACGADPLGGAMLPGTAPGTVLVVRVSKAEPGACARGSSEAGVRCVPRGDGVYVSTDGGGQPTAFAYGEGNEVVVGGSPDATGVAPAVSGLTADQLVAVAQAVLGELEPAS